MRQPETPNLYLSGHLAAWFKIIAVGVITFVAFEAIAVATAMPFVAESLHGERFYALAAGIPLATQLITTGLAGPWVDAKGPQQVIIIGIVLFLSGLVVAALAPGILVFIIGRALQGVGGGMLLVPLYVMVGSYVIPKKQGAFFAAFAIAWVLPSLFGPLIAGFLVDYVHWRWVFGITPLVMMLFFPLAWVKFRKFPQIHEKKPLKMRKRFMFATLASGVLIATLQILSGLKPEQFSIYVLVLALGVSVCLFLSIRHLVPTGTFLVRRGVPATIALRGLLNGTFIGVETFLPLMLKNIHGWDPTHAGLVLTASGVTWAIGSWIQGRCPGTKPLRWFSVIGPVGQLLGTLITMLSVIPEFGGWWVLVGWCLAGFSTGVIFPATSVHALGLTPASKHGKISSALQVADTFGSSSLIAYAGIVYALTASFANFSFAFTIGLMCVLLVFAIWAAGRIFPEETGISASAS